MNGGIVSFVYDVDGNRVAKTVNGVTTRYLVDTNNPTGYSQIVDELTGTQVTRTYTFGQSLISQRELVNGRWVVSFYGYDGQGSVRLLTDFFGAITDTYTYDAFGNLIAATGTTPNEHLYVGEQFDANVGFYYLRARYMDPSIGRFWSMDSYEGSSYDPATLHKYLYVGADPVNKVDPTGHSSIAEELVTLDVNSILSSMSAIRNIAIAAVAACALNFAVTGLLNEADISIGASTPCDAPNRPEKKVLFAHGTSLLSAIAIDTVGVDYEAIIGGGRGSEVPGAFFTFLLEPNPPLALQLASEFALRKEPPHAVMVGKLPQSVFDRLRAIGAIYSTPLTGAGYEQTIFLPQSFRALNRYNLGRWEIIPQ